ncbi:Acetyl esterase/lipase [Aliiroseovarius halocynthiae]|uniref:Alpha/beta hydrolase n=1 Tax=Aliiroseovarius halocynthiae TaxID=985055 RepID=A0A545SRI0_9RHOB|nr:alpha/beta hydrolase [Aliiroseovarius halocynthiae]TQV67574.1 alpha/beta hydrolase [Aliiroseovarius halocynthiae]SMR81590.1 Acetyl esterase/lipase [Aliiroseovarius halocynthiae]
MSWLRRPLNFWLRLTERPALTRASPDNVGRVRKRFERVARLSLHPPRGTKYTWHDMSRPVMEIGSRAPDNAPILLYFHGGGYFFGSPRTVRNLVARMARSAGLRALLPAYRLAPEHPFPAAPDDALAIYRDVIEAHPDRAIVLGGDSAGGGLALVLLSQIMALGLPKPLLTIALSPLTDLTTSGASIRDNDATEVVLPAERMEELAAFYLDGADPRDPRASPLFADFTGAPPVLITVSRSEIFLDDARRMANVLEEQGVRVDLQEADGLPHVWQMFAGQLPEANKSIQSIAQAIKAAIDDHTAGPTKR